MLKIFDPPTYIQPQDMDKMVIAGILADTFLQAATLEAEAREVQNDIKITIELGALPITRKISDLADNMNITNQAEYALGTAISTFLSDIFLAAALDHLPESAIIQTFPEEYATEEWADLFERYDMFSTASLVRACIPSQ